MADDVSRIVQEIMDLTGLKEIPLAKKLRISQSTLNRWKNRITSPNKQQWDRVMDLWRDVKGIRMTIDQKIAPYDAETQMRIHHMVDDLLALLPPPRK